MGQLSSVFSAIGNGAQSLFGTSALSGAGSAAAGAGSAAAGATKAGANTLGSNLVNIGASGSASGSGLGTLGNTGNAAASQYLTPQFNGLSSVGDTVSSSASKPSLMDRLSKGVFGKEDFDTGDAVEMFGTYLGESLKEGGGQMPEANAPNLGAMGGGQAGRQGGQSRINWATPMSGQDSIIQALLARGYGNG